jgi:DNA-binding SARP family transcriptional activator/tetratricopeptide (TPR) repeat protein
MLRVGSSAGIKVAVLGPVRVWLGDSELDAGPVKQQAVLAALVLRPGKIVSAERLLDDVWGEEPPESGPKAIAGYVHRIRQSLGDTVILSERSLGYRFDPAGAETDLARLAELTAVATGEKKEGDLAAALIACSDGLGLFQGEPLAGLPGPFADTERQRLNRLRFTLSLEKAEFRIGLRQYAEAASELATMLAERPHDEPVARGLMRALYGDGRQPEALETYAQLYRSLSGLGLDPSQEMRTLQEAVLRHDSEYVLGVAAQPARPRPRGPFQLPADGYLTGRDRELELLNDTARAATSAGPRVVVVDGMAGIGKTALVVRVAWSLHERYPDGALFLHLHGHSEDQPSLGVQDALRRLLRWVGTDTASAPEETEELAAAWQAATASRRLLLVLDDAEGVRQVRPLLPSGPESLVLVTSRRSMPGLDAERPVSLGPLGSDAATELVRHVVGGERVERELAAVADLVGLLGGLPLALRIAGARMQTRPVWTFTDLVNQLAEKEGRITGLAAEDRSVETAFQISYENLPATSQRVFRALGMSPSVEFGPLVVAAMLGRPVAETQWLLEDLVDANLVQQPAFRRYRLHDIVAEYARRLAEAHGPQSAEDRTRALRLYVAAGRYASDSGPDSFATGPDLGTVPFRGWRDAGEFLDITADELVDIVRHAAAAGQADEACWVAEAVADYLVHRGLYQESRSALEIALSRADASSDPRMAAALRTRLAVTYCLQGQHKSALAPIREALVRADRIGSRREQARAKGALGFCELADGQVEEAEQHFTEVLAITHELDDDWLSGMAPFYLGLIQHRRGHLSEALDYLKQSLAFAEKIGSPRPLSKTLAYIGDILLGMGRAEQAGQALQRAADIADEANDIPLTALCLARLGTTRLQLGDIEAALASCRRARAMIDEQTHADVTVEVRERLQECERAAGELPG